MTGGPIVIERQATGCRVRVEASNPRRTGGALAVDVRVTMYGESIAGTVVLLAADYGPPWAELEAILAELGTDEHRVMLVLARRLLVSAHGPLLAAIRTLPDVTFLEVAEVIEDAASRTVGAT